MFKSATEKQMEEFTELVKPLYSWLQDNLCPHDMIIIEGGHARVISDHMGIPLEVRD